MLLRRTMLAVSLAAGLATPAAALTFNFTTISGDTLTGSEAGAFTAAAAAWSSVFSDPITVNVSIGFRNLGTANGGTILGATSPSFVTVSYSLFKAELAADITSASDASAFAFLPVTAPGTSQTVRLTTAAAKALSVPGGATVSDGSIEFSTAVTFADTRSALSRTNYDLTGIAEHEIGHLLGFDSGVDDTTPTVRDALDLFRYGAAGALSFTKGQAAYFSIDGGATDIANFEAGSGYQASHWLQGTASGGRAALLDPAVSAGAEQDITPLDVLALDVLGYDAASPAAVPVPEPATLVLLTAALLSMVRLPRQVG